MIYPVDDSMFENYWDNVLNEVCTATMTILLYGVFVVLFLIAVHLLHHRKTPGRTTLLILTAAMGILATVQFSLHLVTCSLALRLLRVAITDGGQADPLHPTNTERMYWALVLTQDLVLVTNTVITDGLLVYRCYLVWGRPSKIFLIPPILIMLSTLATGYVTSDDEDKFTGPYHLDPRIVFALNLFTNFVLMSLTAGRIWWVTRKQRAVLGDGLGSTPRYNAAIAIVLESGAIYCCGLIFQVVALSIQDSFSTPVYLSHGTISQLVNIAPTLIVVRVGMGHTAPTGPAQTTDRSLHFLPPARANTNNTQLRFASSEGDRECGASGIDTELRSPVVA
ncbi:hypothetical protein B0H16DRAFT_1758866 [Mycena metata]|uniref:Uncharacterized protein n=1 Tax=Mycena metata TaxID=1033252 RepID=A0AAD7ICP2_9AGAR|nr:hypothetical protein B0H16DRAFT_1758866 [Mycena metata]